MGISSQNDTESLTGDQDDESFNEEQLVVGDGLGEAETSDDKNVTEKGLVEVAVTNLKDCMPLIILFAEIITNTTSRTARYNNAHILLEVVDLYILRS